MALNISQESKQKVNSIVTAVKETGVLMDDINSGKTLEGAKFKPGLGMHTEAESLNGLAKDLNGGLFKLLVMGKFKNGKSTFINALVGRMMMAAKSTATTAVIALVEYGTDENKVCVYENDMADKRYLSLDEFTKEFALTPEDQDIIEKGGRVDRFANVDYAVMQSSKDMFKDGLYLVDSPGLEEENSRTKATYNFVPKANAIIFTLSALSPFSRAEKDYIAANFYDKGLRNVFFVINRINQITESLDDSLKPTVRAYLKQVFTNENGVFDEELFNKRVFYVDAYGALCDRTGTQNILDPGKSIKETGMLEFEAALNEFLNSDDRLHATCQSTLTSMANYYRSAVQKVESEKAAHKLPLAQLEKNATEAKVKLEQLRQDAESLRKTIDNYGTIISSKVYNNLLNCAQNGIPASFNKEVEDEKVDFGVGNMLRMARDVLFRNQAALEQHIKPVTDKVNAYIDGKLKEWQRQAPTIIEQDLEDLGNEVNSSIAEFDMGLDDVVNTFAKGNVNSPISATGKKGTQALQTVLALANWDVSLAVEGMASGGMKWGDYFKHTLMQFGIDLGITLLFGAPFLVPALIVEVVSTIYRGSRMGRDLLRQMGPKAFEQLQKRIQENETSFKADIQDSFRKQSDMIVSNALRLVDEKEAELNRILDEKRNGEKNAAAEAARQDNVLEAIKARLNDVYKVLYGRNATDADIEHLGKSESKKA